MRISAAIFRIVFALTALAVLADAGWACPTCQAGMAEDAQLQRAYALSIGLMMTVPFLLLGTWCVALWRLSIRQV